MWRSSAPSSQGLHLGEGNGRGPRRPVEEVVGRQQQHDQRKIDAHSGASDLFQTGSLLFTGGERAARPYSPDKEPLFVSVLRGAFIFMADIVRACQVRSDVEFIAVSSYGNATSTSGAVKITHDIQQDITGRNLVVIEDILDSGNTLPRPYSPW